MDKPSNVFDLDRWSSLQKETKRIIGLSLKINHSHMKRAN